MAAVEAGASEMKEEKEENTTFKKLVSIFST